MPSESLTRAVNETGPLLSSRHEHSHSERRKRRSDPFLELQDDTSILPAITTSNNGKRPDDADPVWTRVVLTPIMMISFVLSLIYVDHQQRTWRLSQHGFSQSAWSKLSPWHWLDPQPYQDPNSTTWDRNCNADGRVENTAAVGGVPEAIPNQRHRWYTHKNHRQLAKLQIGDALELRGRMVIILGIWAVLALTTTAWIIQKLWTWLK